MGAGQGAGAHTGGQVQGQETGGEGAVHQGQVGSREICKGPGDRRRGSSTTGTGR